MTEPTEVDNDLAITSRRRFLREGGARHQSVLLELLKESEQKGEVRREGQRRATSWYLITDEDRIAARAAQIAAQAKSGGGGRRRTVTR